MLRRAVGRTRATIIRLRRPALVVAGVVVLATILGVGAFAATGFYGQYGAPRTPVSIRSWQLRPASYLASDCRGCHSDAAAATTAKPHAGLLCEACHLPSVAHPGPVSGVVQMLPGATATDCIACHARLPGRPTDFPIVALDRHYAGAECLRCHDPHTSSATKPREVTHPMANLPPCAVCHAPLGLKAYPANHEPAADEVCLACHRPGAGGK
jgi:predicted CXXCH cytochrome family protein